MRRHGLGLLLLAQASSGLRQAPGAILRQQPTSISSPLMYARQPPPLKDGDWVSRFCVATNSLFAQTVFPPIRKAISLRDAGSEEPVRSQQSDTTEQTPFNLALSKLTSPPEMPGLSRPVWLVIAASLPTALGWYGYYKFSVEEELYWDELQREGRATGCGGYGTLLPFVWAVLMGGLGGLFEVPGSETVVEAGAAWILLGQINLYRRVNELVASRGGRSPSIRGGHSSRLRSTLLSDSGRCILSRAIGARCAARRGREMRWRRCTSPSSARHASHSSSSHAPHPTGSGLRQNGEI